MKIKKIKFNKAFSLAESMIVLVVVSIILGVSAPLVARHFSKGTNSVVSVSGLSNNINTAQGNNTFQVGDINKPSSANDNKLEVYGGVEIEGQNITVANNAENTTISNTIDADANINKLTFNNSNDYFTVNSSGRPLDIFIDLFSSNFNEIYYNEYCSNNNNNTYCRVPDDGYLYLNNALGGYEILNEQPETFQEVIVDNNIQKSMLIFIEKTGKGNVTTINMLPAVIPVKKDQYFHCNNSCYFVKVAKTGVYVN